MQSCCRYANKTHNFAFDTRPVSRTRHAPYCVEVTAAGQGAAFIASARHVVHDATTEI